MKKSLLILMMALFSAGVLSAQEVDRLHGFSGGASNASNTTIVLGQAFAFQGTDGDYEVCAGVAEAQLDREMVEEVTLTPDQDYIHPILGTLTAPVTPGDYNVYTVYTDRENYDSVRIYRVNILECTEPVADADGNEYEVVSLAGLCWTKSNLKAQHYMNEDGSVGAEIPVALVYNLAPDDNEDANLEDFGRLYTWYSAVNVPVGSNTAPELVDGFVQGICPTGWHIPTVEEMERLTNKPANELKEAGEQYWLTPNDNNNATDFSARGAGKAIVGGSPAFMTLRGFTDFWTDGMNASGLASAVETGLVPALEMRHFCAQPVLENLNPALGISVRCVRTDNVTNTGTGTEDELIEPVHIEEPTDGE